MVIKIYSKKEWLEYSSQFHDVVFNNPEFKEIENIDFSLVAFDGDEVLGFATIRVLDKFHAYMQYGGAVKKGYKTLAAYLKMIELLKGSFLNITTLIENTNHPMIKLAMKAGFNINGIRIKSGNIYLEHLIEVKHG